MALIRHLGRIVSELLEQFDDALLALDFDGPVSAPSEPNGVPMVADLSARR
jgi:hypothetical protein